MDRGVCVGRRDKEERKVGEERRGKEGKGEKGGKERVGKLDENSSHTRFESIAIIFYPHSWLCDWGWCVHIIYEGMYVYILCLWTNKNFESYFSDRLNFSNIRDRTSLRIYRLHPPLIAPETHSLSSKSRIFLLMCTLLYLSGWMTQLPEKVHR